MAKGKVSVLKASLRSVGWKQEHCTRGRWKNAGADYPLFLYHSHIPVVARALDPPHMSWNNDFFDPNELLGQAFSYEVILSLAGRKVMCEKVKPSTKAPLGRSYRDNLEDDTKSARPTLSLGQQPPATCPQVGGRWKASPPSSLTCHRSSKRTANTCAHSQKMISINAFHELCKVLEAREGGVGGKKSILCFPLRTHLPESSGYDTVPNVPSPRMMVKVTSHLPSL